METETVVLSAKYTDYTLVVPPGRIRGFFAFMRSHYTFEQFKYMEACGEFILRNGPGTECIRTRLASIPLSPTSCGMINSFRYKACFGMILDNDWRIELEFRTGPSARDENGNPKNFLLWSDFPGEIEIGFSFVEE